MHSPELPNELTNEGQYQQVQHALSRESRPPAVLRVLMSLFERYRASRKLGWSRPWNKAGVTTFAAYTLSSRDDSRLLDMARALLDANIRNEAEAFIRALWSGDGPAMGFLFLSEIVDDGQRYESATLSLGRIAPGSPRQRDRVDVIFDCPLVDGRTDRPSRVRIIVDPLSGPRLNITVETTHEPLVADLFDQIIASHRDWSSDPAREWSHWSSAYVNYFGPRSYDLLQSCFPNRSSQTTEVQQAA